MRITLFSQDRNSRIAALRLRMAVRRLALALAATLISVSLAGTLALGLADYCKNSESAALVRAGLRLTPGDAAGWVRLSGKTNGREAREALETARRLNPRDSKLWIQLALRAEAEGNLSEARRDLDRAADVDRGYLPDWTLANFCLRHGDERYTLFLRQALIIALAGSQDPVPVFDLAWQGSGDGAFILNNVVGDDPAALRLYVTYLVETERSNAVSPAALHLAGKDVKNRETLLRACEYLLACGREPEALVLWNRTGPPALDPEHGDVVTNGELRTPVSLGFDWKFNSTPENTITFEGADAGARIDLTGRQPENVDLLSELVPVSAGGTYTLGWEAKAASPRSRSGLIWLLFATNSITSFTHVNIVLTEDWTSGHSPVIVPEGVRVARLVLRLERPPGEGRFSGAVWIRRPALRHAE
ncbi:MAG: hypothetical protein JWO80_4913 [Bryobacterales bacterium]|nr:hypothetical protein [Bryobacterales bacterium]